MRFTQNLLTIQQTVPSVHVTYVEIECHVVSLARHKLADAAIKLNPDYLFWVDDDVIPPTDCLVRMLAHNLPFVSGLYFSRQAPYQPQMYHRVPEQGGYAPIVEYPHGLVQADVVGAGCSLVAGDVYKRLAALPVRYAGDVPLSPWYEFFTMQGEDFYFCERLRDIGVPVMVDTTIQCVHLGTSEITSDVFEAYYEQSRRSHSA
jgi:hypothetical protein